jgi:hypothetical protein
MCAEASTVLRAVAADFFFNSWCLEIPSDNRIRHVPRCVHYHAQSFRLGTIVDGEDLLDRNCSLWRDSLLQKAVRTVVQVSAESCCEDSSGIQTTHEDRAEKTQSCRSDLHSGRNSDRAKKKKTPWSESSSELYRQSDRRLSAKWLPTFADKGCHVVSVTDPYGRILGL